MMTDIVERLRNRNTPYGWLELADKAAEEIERLRAALAALVADVEEYERINNLAPSPGKPDCWQSITHAKNVLR
jgi:hypothetical protein